MCFCSPFTLSYKTIDPNSFFAIPEKLDSIHASSADLDKTIEINWPCSREEEVVEIEPNIRDPSFKILFRFSAEMAS